MNIKTVNGRVDSWSLTQVFTQPGGGSGKLIRTFDMYNARRILNEISKRTGDSGALRQISNIFDN